jgi:hypothetical protein
VSDVQLRGKVLGILYERRNNADGWVPITDVDLSGGAPVSSGEIASICRQLADAGLMRWKPLAGGSAGIVTGMGQITGQGVDVVETGTSPTLRIEFSRNATMPGSDVRGVAGSLAAHPSFGSVSGVGTAVGEALKRSSFGSVSGRGMVAGEAPKPSSFGSVAGPTTVMHGTMLPISAGTPPNPREQQFSGQAVNSEASVLLTPTGYPSDLSGPITVKNFITININGEDYEKLGETMDRLLVELRQSNTIAGEIRDKLIAEMEAGLKILASPKPDPKLIEVLLIRPLKYIGDKTAGPIIGALALAALAAIGRMTGMF